MVVETAVISPSEVRDRSPRFAPGDRDDVELIRARAAEFEKRPVTGTADVSHLAHIHKYLFEGLRASAGQRRNAGIPSLNVVAALPSVPVSRLDSAIDIVFGALADDNRLVGFTQDDFLDRIAYHYDQVNYLHVFAEGNTITERLFWTQVACTAGFILDWRKTTARANDLALRASSFRDYSQLREMFERIAAPQLSPRERQQR